MSDRIENKVEERDIMESELEEGEILEHRTNNNGLLVLARVD